MSASIVVFFVTTWAVSFTAPYMYYTANLGPMLGFVYAGTSVISCLYIYFCVGETNGRSMAEIELFFQDKIPVRQWRTHVFEAHRLAPLNVGSGEIKTDVELKRLEEERIE